MMKAEFWQKGNTLDYRNDSDKMIPANTIVAMHSMVGVAGMTIMPEATGTVHISGVFRMPKSGSNEIAIGTPVYLSASDGGITEEETGNIKAGYAAENVSDEADKILVKLLG